MILGVFLAAPRTIGSDLVVPNSLLAPGLKGTRDFTNQESAFRRGEFGKNRSGQMQQSICAGAWSCAPRECCEHAVEPDQAIERVRISSAVEISQGHSSIHIQEEMQGIAHHRHG